LIIIGHYVYRVLTLAFHTSSSYNTVLYENLLSKDVLVENSVVDRSSAERLVAVFE
jgi:hypothetical protein